MNTNCNVLFSGVGFKIVIHSDFCISQPIDFIFYSFCENCLDAEQRKK